MSASATTLQLLAKSDSSVGKLGLVDIESATCAISATSQMSSRHATSSSFDRLFGINCCNLLSSCSRSFRRLLVAKLETR